jgi:hypothetical protein
METQVPKFEFTPESLKKGFSFAKIVKPETGDFYLQFTNSHLIIFSSDRRRFTYAKVKPINTIGIPDNYKSDEFYLMTDRTALFDSDLDVISVSVNDKSLSIAATGEDQTRQATLKKRSVTARRSPIPNISLPDLCSSFNASQFEDLLKQVSCSASVKETKSDEARRINQVHFYPDKQCAASNARYYASIAFLNGLDIDFSIVSDDLPLAKSFCAHCDGDVKLSQDSVRIYLVDNATGSLLALSKMVGAKPPLSILSQNEFSTEMHIDKTQLAKCLNWSVLAIEGTQRLSFKATLLSDSELTSTDSNGVVELNSGSQELSRLSSLFIKGDSIHADFPVRFFSSIIGYMNDGSVTLRYGHPASPTILEISQQNDDAVRSVHYIQSMKVRT